MKSDRIIPKPVSPAKRLQKKTKQEMSVERHKTKYKNEERSLLRHTYFHCKVIKEEEMSTSEDLKEPRYNRHNHAVVSGTTIL